MFPGLFFHIVCLNKVSKKIPVCVILFSNLFTFYGKTNIQTSRSVYVPNSFCIFKYGERENIKRGHKHHCYCCYCCYLENTDSSKPYTHNMEDPHTAPEPVEKETATEPTELKPAEEANSTGSFESAIETTITSSYNTIESNISSWFNAIKTKTNEIISQPTTQEYKSLAERNAAIAKERLTGVVNSGKELVSTEKIGSYLDELDKELEMVENLAIGTFSKVGKFISGGGEESEGKEKVKSADEEEEIDESESKLLFNVDVQKSGANSSDDVVIVDQLSCELEGLKSSILELYKKVNGDGVEANAFKDFKVDYSIKLDDEELKLFEYLQSSKELVLTKPEFIKLVQFSKKASPTSTTTTTKDDDDDDDDEEDDDDEDWE